MSSVVQPVSGLCVCVCVCVCVRPSGSTISSVHRVQIDLNFEYSVKNHSGLSTFFYFVSIKNKIIRYPGQNSAPPVCVSKSTKILTGISTVEFNYHRNRTFSMVTVLTVAPRVSGLCVCVSVRPSGSTILAVHRVQIDLNFEHSVQNHSGLSTFLQVFQ